MGRGIAGLSALSGYRTGVFESDAAARAGLAEAIVSSWGRAAAKGKLTAEAVAAAKGRLEVASSLEDAASADLVVEAVPESLDLKTTVFQALDRICRPDALF